VMLWGGVYSGMPIPRYGAEGNWLAFVLFCIGVSPENQRVWRRALEGPRAWVVSLWRFTRDRGDLKVSAELRFKLGGEVLRRVGGGGPDVSRGQGSGLEDGVLRPRGPRVGSAGSRDVWGRSLFHAGASFST